MKNKVLLVAAAAGLIFLTPSAFAEKAAGERMGGPGEKHQARWDKVDSDQDGFISKAEFLQRHEQKFAELDSNGDNKLSKDEIKAAKKQHRKKVRKMLEGKLEQLDREELSDTDE